MLAALFTLATKVGAQPTAPWRDSALQLSARIRALRDSLLEGDSTVREVARRDGLVIGASDRLTGAAAVALARFAEARRRWFGGSLPSPDGFRIVLRSEKTVDEWPPRTRELRTMVLAGLPDSGASVRTQRNVGDDRFAETLIDLYAEQMFASAGPQVTKWIEQGAPVSLPEKERRYIAMYAVVTGTGRAPRGCAAGNLSDCGDALGLRPSSMPARGGGYPAFVRVDLLLTALELGGPGAWERLRGTAGTHLELALAAAARLPIDSLLQRWRGDLLALRPIDSPIQFKAVLLAVGWTAAMLLAVLGLARWV